MTISYCYMSPVFNFNLGTCGLSIFEPKSHCIASYSIKLTQSHTSSFDHAFHGIIFCALVRFVIILRVLITLFVGLNALISIASCLSFSFGPVGFNLKQLLYQYPLLINLYVFFFNYLIK